MEGEEDGDHGAEDEVEEGHVHRRLAAPVRRRHQARDTQGGATLDLHGGREGEGEGEREREFLSHILLFRSSFIV